MHLATNDAGIRAGFCPLVVGRPASRIGFVSLASVILIGLSAATICSSASAGALFDAAFRSFDAGPGARSLVIGHFTQGSLTEVVVANSGASTVSLLKSQPDGSLGPPLMFGAGPNRTAAVAAGDVNGDGRLDIVYSDGSSVGVLLGGPERLLLRASYPVGQDVNWVTLADVDGDDALDILAASSHFVSVFLGDGQGAFGSRNDLDYGVGARLSCVVAGDLNEDGHEDMIAVGTNSTGVWARLGHGDGTFGPSAYFAVNIKPRVIALADLNGDGHLDLVSGGGGDALDVDRAAILLGRGDGTFAPRNYLGFRGRMPVVADLNRDGLPDIAFTYGSVVTVLLATGAGNFAPATSFPTGFAASALAIGDINSDGRLDIATANDYTSTISVLLGNGDGSFGSALAYPVVGRPSSATASDLDGDGIPDLVVGNFNWTLSLFPGRGNGSFGTPSILSAESYLLKVVIQDLNHDGVQDLIIGGGRVTVFLGLGGMTYGPARIHGSVNFTGVAVGDLNGDGIPDIAATHPGSSDGFPPVYTPGTVVHVFFGAGNGTFPAETTYAVGLSPTDVAIADVDGNGRNDLVVTNSGSAAISVWLADEAGKLQSHSQYPTAGGSILAVADFDGDGHLDVVLASRPSKQLSIQYGLRGGAFSSPAIIGSFDSPQALSAADLNQDGHVDLILSTDYGNGVTVLRGIGDGSFAAREIYGTGVQPLHVAVGDFNKDGYPDLAVPNAGPGNASSGTVSILRSRSADLPTPALVSLVGVDVSAESVRLTWASESIQASQTRVERSDSGGTWSDLGRPVSNDPGLLEFEDPTVRQGRDYVYRLAVTDDTGMFTAGQVRVHVPRAERLELTVTPNPANASALMTIRLATRDNAHLSIWDAMGRKVWSQQVAQSGPGRHSIALPSQTLVPGSYFVQLKQSRRAITRKIVVVR